MSFRVSVLRLHRRERNIEHDSLALGLSAGSDAFVSSKRLGRRVTAPAN